MTRKKKNLKHKTKTLKIIIFIIILIVVAILLTNLLKGSKWDAKRRLSIVLLGLEETQGSNNSLISVLSIEPRSSQAQLLLIPSNLILEVPFGYGDYTASSVYKLGELDKSKGGGYLIKKSVEYTMGILIDGYLVSADPSIVNFVQKDAVKKIKDEYFSINSLFFSFTKILKAGRNTKSDFSTVDLIKLYLAIRNLRSDQIEILDIDGERLVKDDSLLDGTKVKMINQDILDSFLSNKLHDNVIRKENVSIEVVNGTGLEGQANRFSRVLTRLGADVVFKSAMEDVVEDSCIIELSDKNMRSYEVVKRMQSVYNCQISLKERNQLQSDIKVILGSELIK